MTGPVERPVRFVPPPNAGSATTMEYLTGPVMESEIEQDRRWERHLVWYTVIALLVVAALVTARLTFL